MKAFQYFHSVYQNIFKRQTEYSIAWISSDYFESLLRGENDSKQSDEFQAKYSREKKIRNNTAHAA